MPDHDKQTLELLTGITATLRALIDAVLEQQAQTCALLAYLEAQPGWNVLLWGQVLENCQARTAARSQLESAKSLAAVVAALADFEGPPQ